MSVLGDERAVAVSLAREAGEIAMRYFRTELRVDLKVGDEPVTEADRVVDAHIVQALRSRFPHDAVLSEESPPDPRRFEAARTWMVDPIDGTREFIEGSDGWGVLIGLAVEGRPMMGVIFQPTADSLMEASIGEGAFLTATGSTRRLFRESSVPVDEPVLGVSTRHLHGLTLKIAEAFGSSRILTSGGFGGRAAMAADGQVDIVLHAGGHPKEWDSCALQVILEESGLTMVNCLGEPLKYLQEDPVEPHGVLIVPSGFLDTAKAVVVPIYREHLAAG